MIIDGNNKKQRSILTNKCFYQTTARIMRDFEEKGYANSADETAKVISAYHDVVKKRTKNNFNSDYNAAFQRMPLPRWPIRSFTTMTKKAMITLTNPLKNLTISMQSSGVSTLRTIPFKLL